MDQQKPETLIRYRAMDLLARREHSRLELQRKLSVKFSDDTSLLAEVLDQLVDEGLLSDQRFAEAFVVSRVRKGQGPHRISLELQQRGVSKFEAENAVYAADTNWCELAVNVMTKKYGHQPCRDFSERAKRSKFLQYRGFNSEQISACFSED